MAAHCWLRCVDVKSKFSSILWNMNSTVSLKASWSRSNEQLGMSWAHNIRTTRTILWKPVSNLAVSNYTWTLNSIHFFAISEAFAFLFINTNNIACRIYTYIIIERNFKWSHETLLLCMKLLTQVQILIVSSFPLCTNSLRKDINLFSLPLAMGK